MSIWKLIHIVYPTLSTHFRTRLYCNAWKAILVFKELATMIHGFSIFSLSIKLKHLEKIKDYEFVVRWTKWENVRHVFVSLSGNNYH